MRKRAQRSILMAAAGLAAVVALPPTERVQAQTVAPTRVRYDFPSVGFVRGQTIRVSVANLQPPPTNDLPPPVGEQPPPVPDRVRIVLFDAAGERVADSGPMLYPPGPTRSFDVPRAALDRAGEDRTGRVQVRAMVIVSNPAGLEPGPTVPSLEVLNTATGRTTFVVFPPGPSRF